MLSRRTALRLGIASVSLAALPLRLRAAAPPPFDPAAGVEITTTITTAGRDRVVTYRFWRAVPYVGAPVDAAHQAMNISVPLTIDGVAVDAGAAPVLLANRIGGYMPSDVSAAEGVDEGGMGGPPPGMAPPGSGPEGEAPSGTAIMQMRGERVSNAKLALAAGYVVVEPGARGRTLVDSEGVYYGTAPAGIVDLKAAVRFLRANRGSIPGNMERIISAGTSAGGAMSALLGATGDAAAYAPYLAQIGAAEESDAVFAAGCWCPITDLDHADMAYEWNWGSNPLAEGALDAEVSGALTAAFPAYQAGLGLSGRDGFGALTADSLGAYLTETWLRPEATAYLGAMDAAARDAYLTENPHILWDGAAQFDWPAFLAHVGARKKPCPAFDRVDLSSGENNLFGQGTVMARNFTAFGANLAGQAGVAEGVAEQVALMNPMPALLAGHEGRARNWWLRVGAKDTDTSLSVVANLAAAADRNGDAVDTRLYWDAGHGANEDAEAFIDWIAAITGVARA